MKYFFLKLYNKPFVRNIIVLLSGGVFAQAITFILMPVITRQYAPEALGTLGVFMSITSVVTQVAALSYPLAIVLPKKDAEALGIARLSLLISIAMSLATLFIIFIFNKPIAHLLNIEEFSSYLFTIPVAMIGSSALAILNQWTIRKQLFKIKSFVISAHSLILNGSKVILGMVYASGVGLYILTVFGFFVQATVLLFAAIKLGDFSARKDSSSHPIKTLRNKYIDFPMYRAPELLLNSLSHWLPMFMLASLFSPSAVGYFSLALSALKAPVQIISRSFLDVFYQRLSLGAQNNEQLMPMIYKTTVTLFLISIPAALIPAIWGPELFSFVFSDNWKQSGEYARWLVPWVFIELINKPAVAAMPVLSAQGLFLIFRVISIVMRFAAIAAGYHFYNNAIISVAFFSIVTLILNIILIFIALFISRRHDLNRSKTPV